MNFKRTLFHILAPAGVVLLAACQTTPSSDTAATSTSTTQPAADTVEQSAQASENIDGASLAVFVADTGEQDGWHAVQINDGALYLHPEPVIVRDDLTGVQAGTNKEGDGLLALQLSPEGQRKVTEATTAYPNKRLSLIVGQTLLAAPGYSSPVTTEHLIFAVGSEADATSAARAIAGVPADGSGDAQATGAPTGNPASGGVDASGRP